MALRKSTILLSLTLGLVFGSFAAAQDLAELLPEDTIFALGMQGLSEADERLEPFQAEFERLEVGEALTTLFESQDVGATGGMGEMAESDELGALLSLEVLGQEAWIALSASSFSPLPAATLITQLTPEAVEQVGPLLEQANAQENPESFTEGDYTFYQLPVEDADPIQVVAYAQADDLLMISTNPEVLRGVLRRLGGGGEPNFAESEGYAQTLGTLENGTFYGYLDYAGIADVAEPFSQGFGFDQLVTRLSSAFQTAGVTGGVARLTDEGVITEGFQAVNEAGGDSELYDLLTSGDAADLDTQRFAPEDALGYSVSATDLSGWYDYLNSLATSVPELGGDLDSLLLSFTGINLRQTFFDWTDGQVVTVTTGLGEVAEPGVPSENLLGEAVYLIRASDESEAEEGLAVLFESLSQSIAAFSDPMGGSGGATSSTAQIGDVEVTQYDITDGVSLSYAVTDGYALIATTEDAMRSVLEAEEPLDVDLGVVPEDASSATYSDAQATLEGSAQQIGSQLELAAGLGGASGLNFDEVENASSVLEEYLSFVASRLGNSVSYSERSDEGITSYSETEVDWEE